MLKIVYPVCCGIDVHKTFVVACIAATDSRNITTYKRKRFSTFTNSLRELASWLQAYSCEHVCMESTGKYWIPVYNVLEGQCKITLAHPKYVRAIRGQKTDVKDAKWIADLFKHGLVNGSFIPPLAIRQLRDLVRYRMKLTNYMASEKNRVQNSLTYCNIQLGSVVSDIFGLSSRAIISSIIEKPDTDDRDLSSLVHYTMHKKIDDIRLAVDGTITREQAAKIAVIFDHYDSIARCKEALEDVISSIVQEFRTEIALVSTVPGIQYDSAIAIISEIGVDMSVFPTSKHLCSWAGLTPQNNESAGKKKSVRISGAGRYLKPFLIQCASTISRSEKYPEFRSRYLSIKKRRGHQRAVIALARMMLTAIYHILKKHEPYSAEGFRTVMPLKFHAVSIEDAASILRRQGYVISGMDSVPDVASL